MSQPTVSERTAEEPESAANPPADPPEGSPGLPPMFGAAVVASRRRTLLGRLRGSGGMTKRNVTLLFAVLLIAGLGVSGVVVFARLHDATGSAGLGWGLVFAFIPVPPLFAVYLWLDRNDPQPAWLLALAFVWGACVATMVALFLNDWGAHLVRETTGGGGRAATFVAPPVEELAKGSLVVIIALTRRKHFNGVVNGLVFAGLVGLGFAFTENIMYYGRIYNELAHVAGAHEGLKQVERLFLMRGVASPFLHPLFTSCTGIGVGIAVRNRSTLIRILAPVTGYLFAVAAHATWNGTASVTGDNFYLWYVFLIVPLCIALTAFAAGMRNRESTMIAARLLDYVRFGWLTPEEIPYVVTAPARRRLRRAAKRSGESTSAQVRAYLRDAARLAYLRDRMVREVAGPDAVEAERELLDQLRSLQPAVVPLCAGR